MSHPEHTQKLKNSATRTENYKHSSNQQTPKRIQRYAKMQLSTLLLAGLVLATGSAADKMMTTTSCPMIGACNSQGEFITDFGRYYINANKDCRKPDIPAMTRLCMDWKKGRAHFQYKNQKKRCLKRTGPDFDVGPCRDSSKKCSRQWWYEVPCTW